MYAQLKSRVDGLRDQLQSLEWTSLQLLQSLLSAIGVSHGSPADELNALLQPVQQRFNHKTVVRLWWERIVTLRTAVDALHDQAAARRRRLQQAEARLRKMEQSAQIVLRLACLDHLSLYVVHRGEEARAGRRRDT